MKKALCTALSLIALTALLQGTQAPVSAQKPSVPKESRTEFEKRTKWWREARFGMFIHWGLYAVPADSSQGLAEWYFSNHSTKDPATGKKADIETTNSLNVSHNTNERIIS